MSTVGSACCAEPVLRDSAAALPIPLGVQQLSWRCFAVGKNVSNRRRKLLNAGTRHDDTVTATVSFLSDAQEPAAIVLPELDVEVLALNLQFSRLDDVVHFALRTPSLWSRRLKWKKNPCPLREFLRPSLLGKSSVMTLRKSQAMRGRLLCSVLNLDSGAFLILDHLACPIPLILALIDHPMLNGPPPSRCRLRPSPPPTTHTLRFALEISRCLQPAIYSRLPGG